MDISAAKAAELYQEKRATEAIELREASERFVDMTSHEVRNPLSAAILSSDASIERTQKLLRSAQAVQDHMRAELNETLEDLKIIRSALQMRAAEAAHADISMDYLTACAAVILIGSLTIS